jgi:hypothetical protein
MAFIQLVIDLPLLHYPSRNTATPVRSTAFVDSMGRNKGEDEEVMVFENLRVRDVTLGDLVLFS